MKSNSDTIPKINKKVVQKLIKTVDVGLVSGVGFPEPGKMCVEAAVCYSLGLPHGDEPLCVSKSIRALKIVLNDARWSSNKARAHGLRTLAVLQLGTHENFDEGLFIKKVCEFTIGNTVPAALRHAASIHPTPKHKAALEKAAQKCELEKSKTTARAARAAATAATAAARADAAAAYAAYATADAAANAAYAAYATAYAADAAANAARAAATAATAAARADAARADADKELISFAKGIENILVEMKVPGVKWLSLLK